MTVDLWWRDACSASGGAFTKADETAGRPATMTPIQLAAMQRPFKRGDADGRQAQGQLRAALSDAVQGGTLPAEATAKQARVVE